MFWTEPPFFRVCSKWSQFNLRFGINRTGATGAPSSSMGFSWSSTLPYMSHD